MNNKENSPYSPSEKPQPGYPGQAPPGIQSSEEKHHWLMWLLILVTLVVAGIVIFRIAFAKKPKPPAPPPPSIAITNAWKGDIEVSVTAIGSVQPIYTASISPRVDGQLKNVNYVEGQMVKSNDLLAVIDPAPYQALLVEAKGQLARDQAVLEGAKVDLQRYLLAYQRNAVPKQQYDDQLALVHQDEGSVLYDEGQISNAAVQVDYSYVRAPFSGRVGLRLVDPGNVVHAANSNAMVMLAQLQPITVVFNVAEDYLPQIQEQLKGGDPMKIEAYDRTQENKIATGSFLTLDNLIDTATGTIRIKSMFSNEDMSLFPNQFVNAKLIIKVLHGVTLVPTFAIQRNPDGPFLYVLTNATATNNGVVTNFTAVTMRNIVVGTSDANETQIVKGLHPHEAIAINNFNKLGEGVPVNVRKPGQNGKPGEGMGGGHHGGGTNQSKADMLQSKDGS